MPYPKIAQETLQSVYQIYFCEESSEGTAFIVKRDGRQYIVTARHLLEKVDPESISHISLRTSGQSKKVGVKVVGNGDKDCDVMVFAACKKFEHALPLMPCEAGVYPGQPVLALGHPKVLETPGVALDPHRHTPIIKSGIVSGFDTDSKTKRCWIDIITTSGFSGGPVVCYPPSGPFTPDTLQAIGVIKGCVREEQNLVNNFGSNIGFVRGAAGLSTATDTEHVINLIDANPIGFVEQS